MNFRYGFCFPVGYIADKAAMKGRPLSLPSRHFVGGMQHLATRAIFMLAVWLSLATYSVISVAAEPPDGQLYDIDIPPLNAAVALNQLAEQTGAIMLFPYDIAETRHANAVLGRFKLMDALSELLKDTGLSSGLSDKRVIQIALDEPVERQTGEGDMVTAKVPFKNKIGMFLASLFVVSAASAQDAQDAEDTVEEVIVTGSRIARDSFKIATPLVTLDSASIQDSGLGSLGEILMDEIPALFEATSNTNSQSRIGSTGLVQVDLRQLGANRTLVLIDGRRTVQSSFETKAVSLNTIPTGMVDRIEVITGGSSAAYGSDAIAGVINIITVQDKVGFGFESRGGVTGSGGGEEVTVNADYGMNFHDGRGYLFAAASYDRQYGIRPEDRRVRELDFDYNNSKLCNEWATETGDQCERDITEADYRNRSDNLPGGVFEEGSSNAVADGGFWYDENGVLQTGWVEDRDGINVNNFVLIKVPDKQFNAAIKMNYDISEKTRVLFQVHYNETKSFNDKTPENYEENDTRATFDRITGEPGTVQPGRIAITNPFVPAIIAANSGADITWDKLMIDVGQITTDNTRTTWRVNAGLQGSIDMFDNDWQWDVSFGYGRFEQVQLRANEIDVLKTQQALDASVDASGNIICNDAAARAAGCVPLNMFGVGSITPAMADWIRVNPITNPVVEQFSTLGYLSGDLFDLPAGPVSAVFGFEYNRDEINLSVTDGLEFGGITFNIVPSFAGNITTTELFSELSVPVHSSITTNLSARVSDYSPENIGVVFSYTGGFTWEPVDGYLLRGNYSRAQRAPDLRELLSPVVGDFDSITDICDGTTATSTAPGHDNCRLDPDIANAVATLGTFDGTNGNGYSPSAGNRELKQETADTFTIGVSIAPTFWFLDGLRVSVDYYDIEITDAINEIGNEEILAQCFNSSIAFGSPNTFCDAIFRNSDGDLIQIRQQQFNLNKLTTSGFDVAVEYSLDLANYGSLSLSGNYTHIFDNEQEFEGIDGVETEDFVNLDNGIFDDRATASLTWRSTENLRIKWKTIWKGPIIDDQGRVEDHLERFAANDALCAAGDPACITNPEVPNFLFYKSYFRHDLSVNYDMEINAFNQNSALTLYGGVRNVFDDKGPLIPQTGDSAERGVAGFDSKFDGGIGRFFFAGFKIHFGG